MAATALAPATSAMSLDRSSAPHSSSLGTVRGLPLTLSKAIEIGCCKRCRHRHHIPYASMLASENPWISLSEFGERSSRGN